MHINPFVFCNRREPWIRKSHFDNRMEFRKKPISSFQGFRYGAYFALCFLLVGCANSVRQWEIDEVITRNPSFNGGRAILGPDSDQSNLELELVRVSSGIRFYINLLFLKAPPWKEDPTKTSLTIQFENQEPWIVHPYLLEGEQRLLLPGDVADYLIRMLLEENCFTIQIGRSQLSVVPTQFVKIYQKLLDLSIEEPISSLSPELCENRF